jgi:nitrate reductase NapE component
MDTHTPSVATSDLPSPEKQLREVLKKYAKFAVSILPLLAVIALGVYFYFIVT